MKEDKGYQNSQFIGKKYSKETLQPESSKQRKRRQRKSKEDGEEEKMWRKEEGEKEATSTISQEIASILEILCSFNRQKSDIFRGLVKLHITILQTTSAILDMQLSENPQFTITKRLATEQLEAGARSARLPPASLCAGNGRTRTHFILAMSC